MQRVYDPRAKYGEVKKNTRRERIPPSAYPTLHHHAPQQLGAALGSATLGASLGARPASAPAQQPEQPAPGPFVAPISKKTHVRKSPPKPLGPRVTAFSLPRFLDSATDGPRRGLEEEYKGCCWWDHHPFETRAVGLPIKHDEQRNVFWMFGFFCSWNCALAYAWDSTMVSLRERAPLLVLRVLRLLSAKKGVDFNDVVCRAAPHWSVLKAYGGAMDIAEFRARHKTRLRTEVYPPWMRVIPLGMVGYEFDDAHPVPYMFSETFSRVHDSEAGAEAAHTSCSKKRKLEEREKEKERERAMTPHPAAQNPRGKWTTFRMNVLTGRREPVRPPTDEELKRAADALQTRPADKHKHQNVFDRILTNSRRNRPAVPRCQVAERQPCSLPPSRPGSPAPAEAAPP